MIDLQFTTYFEFVLFMHMCIDLQCISWLRHCHWLANSPICTVFV